MINPTCTALHPCTAAAASCSSHDTIVFAGIVAVVAYTIGMLVGGTIVRRARRS